MNRNWTQFKGIIETYEQDKGLFLSLINADGTILCANAKMQKEFGLKDPREAKVNLFDMIHPANIDGFKNAVQSSSRKNYPSSMEIYLKNGYYHPMKWRINYVQSENKEETFLCVGHKIVEDERLQRINQLGAENYQLIVEGVKDGILFQDVNGELIAVNQKTADILETTLEKLYQLNDIKHLWKMVWLVRDEQGKQVAFEEAPFTKALHLGIPQAETLVISVREGESRWLRIASQPLFKENATVPYAVVSHISDITNEKSLSTELSDRKALLNAFMSQSPNLSWVVNEKAELVLANAAFFNFTKVSEIDTIGETMLSVLPESIATDLHKVHLQVLETGQQVQFVKEVTCANGNNHAFHINIFPIKGLNGKKKVGGQAINLSDKHKIEKELIKATERLLLLSKATNDAIWEWDMQTGNIFRNEALMEMIGYQQENAKGLSWWLRRIHMDDRDRVSEKVKESTDTGKHSWQDEYRFKCSDNTYKHMRDRGYIVYENGLPVKMIGSLQDVTNLKNLEDQLTVEKIERQKQISETVIQVQEKERTRIGHELHDNVNQLLATTKLFVDLLTPANSQEQELKDKSIDYILTAIDEIRKISKELVVPQLKDKGLVDSIKVLIEDIHLTTSIKVILTNNLEGALLSQGIQVTLFRIIQEQFKNILKHSKANNVEVTLQHMAGVAQLIIKDDGIGFNMNKTAQGIGLSNISDRVRFYNGSFTIQTEPGKGCISIAEIPLI
jgi:PAS domain S-box-containing protein